MAETKTFKEKIKALLDFSEEVVVETPVEAPVEALVVLMEDGEDAPVEDVAAFSDEQVTAIKGIVEDVINELAGGVEDAPVVDMTEEVVEELAAVEVVEETNEQLKEKIVELNKQVEELTVEPIKHSPTGKNHIELFENMTPLEKYRYQKQN